MTPDLRAQHPHESYLVAGTMTSAIEWLQGAGYARLDGNVFVWGKGDERVRVVGEAERLRSCPEGSRLYVMGNWWRRSDRRVLEATIAERKLVTQEVA